jgi:hypothetical protein
LTLVKFRDVLYNMVKEEFTGHDANHVDLELSEDFIELDWVIEVFH